MKFVAWADILVIGGIAVAGLSRTVLGLRRKKPNWTKEGLALMGMALLGLLRYWTVMQSVFTK